MFYCYVTKHTSLKLEINITLWKVNMCVNQLNS